MPVTESSTPLPLLETISKNGLVGGIVDGPRGVEAFNSSGPVKLGLPAPGPSLAKHTEMEVDKLKKDNKQEKEAPERALGDGDGDVEMKDQPTTTEEDADEGGEKSAAVPNGDTNKDKDELLVTALEPIGRGEVLGFGSAGNFASIDLAKEVKAVTDARKRIKLGDKAMVAGATGSYVRQPSMPSACCYTVFDGGEGYVRRACDFRHLSNIAHALVTHHPPHLLRTTSTAISEDASYLAAGSAESVIRLWSLKGETLKTREYGYATKIAQGGGRSGYTCALAVLARADRACDFRTDT
jgi:transcription initiation factor TFIID subunit 5